MQNVVKVEADEYKVTAQWYRFTKTGLIIEL